MQRLLIFDGDCAFCTTSAYFIRDHVRPAADVVAWQHADIASLGLTAEQCSSAVQWVDGPIRLKGAPAIAAMLRSARGAWPVAGRALQLPLVRQLADVVYAWVAANRHRLPGGTPACMAAAA